jgi:hypothetical protein
VTRLPPLPLGPKDAARLVALLAASLVVSAFAWAAPTREEVLLRLAGDPRVENFVGAQAPGITVTDKDLSQTNWRNADLRGVTFQRVRLDGAVLTGASLRGAILEDVSLTDADLSGADLSGARLRLVNLAGAKMEECQLTGASLQLVLMSVNGGTHGEALRLALGKAAGQQFSRPWVGGLSGDAFAFVYNTEDPGFWPGTPFTVNPLTAAAANLGLDAQLRLDFRARKLLLAGDKPPPGVRLLPMQSDRVGLWLLRDMPLWALVEGREARDKRTYLRVQLPPFGQDTIRQETLLALWDGPWPTLEPAGAPNVRGRQPLVTFTMPRALLSPGVQARRALQQAAAIIQEKRTYGPLVPGQAGLLRLAADLRAVAEAGDLERAKRLALWEQFPRQCFLGSRAEAGRFLEEALPALDETRRSHAQQALVLYRAEVVMVRDQWPGLAPGLGADPAQVRSACSQAADIIGKVAASERDAAQLLAQAGAE